MAIETGPAKLSVNGLRRLAEKADGLRGKHPVLVVDESDEIDVVEQSAIGNRHPLIDLDTPSDGPGLQFQVRIGLTVDDAEYPRGPELDIADAIFTSQSAVEKFVFPYYTRVRTPRELEAMARAMFDDKANVAIIHKPSTLYGILRTVRSDFGVGTDGSFKDVPFSRQEW